MVAAAFIAGGMIAATPADAAQGLLTTRRFDERTPSVGLFDGKVTLAWSRAPNAHPRRVHVFVRRGKGNPRRVNRRGTRAWAGGVDGRIVVYQEINNRDSDLKTFDWKTGDRRSIRRANTRKWEWGPTKSGKWVLFARSARHDTVVLLNMKTGDTRTLARSTRRGAAFVGQVKGDFAVFSKCSRRACDVFRYRISTRQKITIQNKRRAQYAPSVTSSGTVYFAGSAPKCGTRVILYRRRNGKTTRIARLGSKDTLWTQAAARVGGGTNVYYEQGGCGDRADFDIYKTRG